MWARTSAKVLVPVLSRRRPQRKERAQTIADWLRKHWFYLGMAGVLVTGYLWVASGQWLGQHNRLLVAVLMFLMGLGLSPRGILTQLRKVRALGLFLLVSYGLAPLVAYGVGRLLFSQRPDLFTGLIIMGATATTLSSCVVWSRLAGGNDALALVMSMVGNSLQFVVTPAWLALLLGASVQVDAVGMMKGLVVVVLIPILSSQAVVVLSRGRALRLKPLTGVLARVLVLGVILVAVSKAAGDLLTVEALYSSVAVVAVHGVLLGVSWWVLGRFLPEAGDRIALLFSGGQKTLPSSTMIATTYFAHLQGALLPVLLYHLWQLTVDSVLLERLRPTAGEEVGLESALAGDG